MQELGLTLREARKARGMSLEDVARVTKVSRSTLQAIEDGDRTLLPAPVYVRGFVRAFAQAVGLDPRDLPSPDAAPAPGLPDAAPLVSPARTRGPATPADRFTTLLGGPPPRRGLSSGQALLLLLAVGMLLVGWLMVGSRQAARDATASPAPPAIQEQFDAVTSFTRPDAGR